MSATAILVGYYFTALWKGIVFGLVVRFLVAIYLKAEMTWPGFLRTGLFFGIVSLIVHFVRVL